MTDRLSEILPDRDVAYVRRLITDPSRAEEVANWYSWIASSCTTEIEALMGVALCSEFLGEIKFEKRTWTVVHPQYRTVRLSDNLRFKLDFLVTLDTRQVGVECDGKDFHSSPEQRNRDAFRTRTIERSAGLSIIRFTGSEITRDACSCARKVREALWS